MKNLEFLIKIYWNKSIGLKSIGIKSIFIFFEILKYKYKIFLHYFYFRIFINPFGNSNADLSYIQHKKTVIFNLFSFVILKS